MERTRIEWPLSVTLTLGLRNRVMGSAYCLTEKNI